VDGWLTPDEGQALMNLAHGAVVLELGAYRGRSTIALASVAKRVVSVDWHRGDPAVGNSDTLGRFMANVEAAGVRGKVVPVVGRIEDVGPILGSRTFHLVFIDDDHEATVRLSTELAVRVVRPGGWIAWHDWNYRQVQEAAAACCLTPVGFRGVLAWARA
jgi:predicted O-methyltransferase YrrM